MKQGWEIKKLGEVCETSSGGTPSKTHKEYYEGGNIPWLRSGEVSQGLIYDTELYITAEGLDNSSAKIFPIDTVVIAMYGATVGQVGVLKNAMSTNQAVCGIFPTPKFAPLFLVYYLKAKKSYFLSLAAGGAQPNISQQIIRDTYISIPPREEQERIVAELDCLSGVIEKKREQLKELDALAESIFYTMFGDPSQSEHKVKRLAELSNAKLSYGSGASAIEYDGETRYVRITDIKEDGELNDDKASPSVIDDKYLLNEGDILFARSGATVGKTYHYKEKDGRAIYAGYLIRFIPNTQVVLPSYIFRYTKTAYYRAFIQSSAQAVAQPNINAQQYGSLMVPVPPLTLQQEFADKIEAIEKQKELIKQSITETEVLFNSRMDYYFN